MYRVNMFVDLDNENIFQKNLEQIVINLFFQKLPCVGKFVLLPGITKLGYCTNTLPCY